jgi:hypothetical protein
LIDYASRLRFAFGERRGTRLVTLAPVMTLTSTPRPAIAPPGEYKPRLTTDLAALLYLPWTGGLITRRAIMLGPCTTGLYQQIARFHAPAEEQAYINVHGATMRVTDLRLLDFIQLDE